jgi:hypothetical protein
MGASTGNMLVDNPEILDGIFRDAPTPIITHCEDTPMIDAELARYKAQYGDDIPAACHPDIRSRAACLKSTELAISLARKHDTRLHVLHISTADELALFERGPLVRADGSRKRITAETASTSCDSTAPIRAARASDQVQPGDQGRRRPPGADRGAGRRHHRRACHRPRPAYAGREGTPPIPPRPAACRWCSTRWWRRWNWCTKAS